MSEPAKWTGAFDAERIGAWMDTQGLPQGEITAVTPLTGGTQNILVRFTRAGRDYVFRGPPPHVRANSNETMRREARVLGAIGGSDVPHPALIAACADETTIGASFYLMQSIDGFNAREAMISPHKDDPAIRRDMGFAMVEAIAALANVDHVARGLGDFGKGQGFLERQVARWQAQLDSYREFPDWRGYEEIPGVERVQKWLDDNRPATYPLGILHGDFHFGNVLFRRDCGKLAAVVDWELVTVGDPMLDLGHLLTSWPEDGEAPLSTLQPWEGFPSRKEIIARYSELTGRDIALVPWFEVLACYRLGIILEGSNARASAGKAPKAIGNQLHATTVALFTRANAKI